MPNCLNQFASDFQENLLMKNGDGEKYDRGRILLDGDIESPTVKKEPTRAESPKDTKFTMTMEPNPQQLELIKPFLKQGKNEIKF